MASIYFGQQLGNIVAYQVPLQNRVSELSNLIYTTASYFLRILIDQNSAQAFENITHIVVNDVHLNKAYTDFLLKELNTTERLNSSLRIILLSNSENNCKYIDYFKATSDYAITNSEIHYASSVMYMEDIRRLLSGVLHVQQKSLINFSPTVYYEDHEKQNLNHLLDSYACLGTDDTFKEILYMLSGKNSNINYQHTICGTTTILIASKLSKIIHLRTLLQLGADPFIMDNCGLNAVLFAYLKSDIECLKILNEYCAIDNIMKDGDAAFCDFDLVTNLILKIFESDLEPGNVLIFMPNYEQILKLYYVILKQRLEDKLSNVVIKLVHSMMEEDKLRDVIKSDEKFQIVIATDVAENILFFFKFKYVIDSARCFKEIYNPETNSRDFVYDWNSKENLANHSALIQNTTEQSICFRLIPSKLYEELQTTCTHEILTMPLERICLIAQLISKDMPIEQYFENFIVQPPLVHIRQTLEILKKMDILDELGKLTWLGCKLIEIPVDFEIGKVLIYAIILQCLDPVLTIISFSQIMNEFQSSCSVNELLNYLLQKFQIEQNLETTDSDHLLYLRCYQHWENSLHQLDNMLLLKENEFLCKFVFEKINVLRAKLVGFLRSAYFIHNQGELSMNYINLKSDSWPLIKAAFVGGMYPKICVYDSNLERFKAERRKQLIIRNSSVLKNLCNPNANGRQLKSPWLVYSKESNAIIYNSISCCTLITALTIAMFAGSSKLNSATVARCLENTNKNSTVVDLCIDGWISFTTDEQLAHLILKTRQNFFNIYKNFLRNCHCADKYSNSLTYNVQVLEKLKQVLTAEDAEHGFLMPEKIGLRPKAAPQQ